MQNITQKGCLYWYKSEAKNDNHMHAGKMVEAGSNRCNTRAETFKIRSVHMHSAQVVLHRIKSTFDSMSIKCISYIF